MENNNKLNWLQWQKTNYMSWVMLILCPFMMYIFYYINIIKNKDDYDIAFWFWESFFIIIFILILFGKIILEWKEYKNDKLS